MTRFYVAVRAYGDCLISLSQLRHLPPSSRLHVAGTPLTTRIATLMRLDRFPITEILPDVAAFQDVRVRGPFRAAEDLLRARRGLRRLLNRADEVIFEHRDWRNRLILPLGMPYHEPDFGRSVYRDRHALLAALFGGLPPLEPVRPIGGLARRWLLNPGARQPFKALPSAVVRNVLACASARGASVTLLDPERQHEALAAQAGNYVPAPSLDHAMSLLQEADAYIGGDSLFLHLAYFLRIPLFAIPPTRAPYPVPPGFLEYFYPPGLVESGSFLGIDDACDARRLAAAVESAGRGSATASTTA